MKRYKEEEGGGGRGGEGEEEEGRGEVLRVLRRDKSTRRIVLKGLLGVIRLGRVVSLLLRVGVRRLRGRWLWLGMEG